MGARLERHERRLEAPAPTEPTVVKAVWEAIDEAYRMVASDTSAVNAGWPHSYTEALRDAKQDVAIALDAVAARMAELELDNAKLTRLYNEACECGSGHARIAELEQQRDEYHRESDEARRERDQRPTPEAIIALIGAAGGGEGMETVAVLTGLRSTVSEYCNRLAREAQGA